MVASDDPKGLAKVSFLDYTQEKPGGGWRVRAAMPFEDWYAGLADGRARHLVAARIERLMKGHLGASRAWGGGLWELRIHFGQGLRVYFAYLEGRVVLLLSGGSKRGQRAEVGRARATLKSLSPKST